MRILGKFVKSVKLAFLLPAGPMDIVCPTATRKIPRIRHPEPWTIGAMDSGRWEVE